MHISALNGEQELTRFDSAKAGRYGADEKHQRE